MVLHRDHAGLLGSADIELVVTAPHSISREQRKDVGLVAARVIFVDLRYKYTAIIGRQVSIHVLDTHLFQAKDLSSHD